MLSTAKAVYCCDGSAIFSCQNLLFRSMLSMVSCIQVGVDFLLWPGVKTPEVYAELQQTIILPHQHHGITPMGTRRVGWHPHPTFPEYAGKLYPLAVEQYICSLNGLSPSNLKILFGSRENSWGNSRSIAFSTKSGFHSLSLSNLSSFLRVARRRSCLSWIHDLGVPCGNGSTSFSFLT